MTCEFSVESRSEFFACFLNFPVKMSRRLKEARERNYSRWLLVPCLLLPYSLSLSIEFQTATCSDSFLTNDVNGLALITSVITWEPLKSHVSHCNFEYHRFNPTISPFYLVAFWGRIFRGLRKTYRNSSTTFFD